MYGELTRHAKLIAGLQKQARKLQDATDGMLVLIETAYTTELPKDYAIVEQTPLGAKSAATDGPVQISEAEREQKRAQVSQLRANLAERLEAEVHTPANNYIADVRAAKVELKNLEKVRLSLDTQRRKTAKAEVKKVKQTLNKGANSNSFVERHTVATQQLEGVPSTWWWWCFWWYTLGGRYLVVFTSKCNPSTINTPRIQAAI